MSLVSWISLDFAQITAVSTFLEKSADLVHWISYNWAYSRFSFD